MLMQLVDSDACLSSSPNLHTTTRLRNTKRIVLGRHGNVHHYHHTTTTTTTIIIVVEYITYVRIIRHTLLVAFNATVVYIR